MDRSNKKAKWTVMKYVRSFDLLVQYANLIRDLKARVDENAIIEINSIMEDLGVYQPKFGKPSVDTTNFKICQIVYSMFGYRNDASSKNELVFSPLGNLLLDNIADKKYVARVFATMLYGMPFNHPYNRMTPDFDIYPLRLVFKLLTDSRLGLKLYEDEIFYHIFWIKSIDISAYEDLVKSILSFRGLPKDVKLSMCTERLSVQDALANALHETHYLFGQLESAGIVTVQKGEKVGVLNQGGFGRRDVPDFPTEVELLNYKPTGRRAYRMDSIKLTDTVFKLLVDLLEMYPFYEKPHDLLETLGKDDYILHLYNFYPSELLSDLGIQTQKRIQTMLQIAKNIERYSRNQDNGDCYKFENVLADAFNEFDNIKANVISGAGNTDIECLHLTINEKFAVEAKSTQTKLAFINSGRLQLHRDKIKAKYTIIVAPYYKPSVDADIKGTVNVIITASSLSNFLYQYTIHSKETMLYDPLYEIIKNSFGTNITSKVNEYVGRCFGIGRS